MTVKFVADEVYLFLREPDKNRRQAHADLHEVTTDLEMLRLYEQLQENEHQTNLPTQEEDTAAYTSLDLSREEFHVYDVISR